MISPAVASMSAWRRVPGPLSSALVTMIVLPLGTGVIVDVGGAGDSVGNTAVGVYGMVVTAGDGVDPQLFKTRTRMVVKRSAKVTLFFFIHEPSIAIVQPNMLEKSLSHEPPSVHGSHFDTPSCLEYQISLWIGWHSVPAFSTFSTQNLFSLGAPRNFLPRYLNFLPRKL